MALPSTPMLDDFARPDEDPLSNQGRWAKVDTTFTVNLTVTSNHCERASGVNESGAYWVPSAGTRESEGWAVVGADITGGSNTVAILLRVTDPGGAGTAGFYLCGVTFGVAFISRYDNGVNATSLGSTIMDFPVVGDVVVARAASSSISLYLIRGTSVSQLVAGEDKTYSTGAVGLYLGATGDICRRFGGGMINSVSDPPPMRAGRSRW